MQIDDKQIREQVAYAEKILKRLDKTASLKSVNELREKANGGDIEAMVELGKIYLYADKPIKSEKRAYELFAKAAEKSDMVGQAYAAYCIYFGMGTLQDKGIAMKILASLCVTECATAYELLGTIYLQESEYVKAASCFKRECAISKSANSVYYYAMSLYAQRQYEDAVKWFKRANEMDTKLGGYELAICTLEGFGIEKNIEVAIELLKRAIDNGDHVGSCNIQLAKIYLNGDTVKADLNLAEKYIQDASDSGADKDKVMNLMRESLRKKNADDTVKRKRNIFLCVLVTILVLVVFVMVVAWSEKEQDRKSSKTQTTEIPQKNTDTAEKQFLSQIYNTYRVEDDKLADNFASALGNISVGQTPLGVIGDFNPKFNRYAVYDVDGDGKEELILVYDNPDALYMSEYICGFDESNSRLYVEYKGVPYLDLYANGVAVYDTISKNTGHSVSYEIYKFDDNTKEYSFNGYVEDWDRSVSQTDKDGNDFPTDVDNDGDGKIFVIYDKKYNSRYVDEAEYEQFQNELHNGNQSMNIIFSDIKQ